jgi:hypothetical protein
MTNTLSIIRLLMLEFWDGSYYDRLRRTFPPFPPEYRNDEPLLLWTICNNIHRNNITFFETIKSKIRSATLSEFGDDISKYILHVKDNLRLITANDDASTEHNDLITYILNQLTQAPIELFKEAAQHWQIDYLESKLPDTTPTKLLKLADDKVQILRHAGQWKVTESPAIMALKLELQRQKEESTQFARQLVAHIGQLTHKHRNNNPRNSTQHPPSGVTHHNASFLPTKGTWPGHQNEQNHRYPPWMTTPPNNVQETQVHDRKVYSWRTKCHNGMGLWVNHHNSETHVDGYRNQRRHLEYQQCSSPYKQTNIAQRHVHLMSYPLAEQQEQHQQNGDDMDTTPSAQLSLLDYLNCYLPEEDHNAPDDTQEEYHD